MTWISDIGSAITSIFTTLGNAVLNFIKEGFTTLFLEVGENGSIEGLSTFGLFTFVLMGISLVMGLTYVVYNLVKKHK